VIGIQYLFSFVFYHVGGVLADLIRAELKAEIDFVSLVYNSCLQDNHDFLGYPWVSDLINYLIP